MKRSTFVAPLVACCLALRLVLAQVMPALPPPEDPAKWLATDPAPARTKGTFTLAAAGDLIISEPMVHETLPGLGRTWELLRGADLAVANMETPPVDAARVHTFPNGDALLRAPPTLAADARAMGFRLLSLANNHSIDLGPQAALNTRALFARAGVGTAGLGATLEEARAPGYASTPKGRVALVAVATTVKPNSMAQDAMPDWPARPGVNVLHLQKIVVVRPAELDALREIARRQSYGNYRPPAATATELTLDGTVYRAGQTPRLTWEMNAYDRAAILRALHRARLEADLVVFSIHAHESDSGIDDDNPVPADFLVTLFHEAVAAGADVVVGGGPHGNRGIEIYRGKPILYGMGVFTMSGHAYFSQEAQIVSQPASYPTPAESRELGPAIGDPRSWLESMVVVTEFVGGVVTEVRIHPIDLRGARGSARRGRPVLAEGAEAERLLDLIGRDSAQFGTTIERRGSVGVIRVGGR